MIRNRKEQVEFAIANLRLEGIELSPEELAITERYISGELSWAEAKQATLELPHSQ